MQLDFSINETWLHRVNPSVKFLIMLVLFIALLFVHNPNVLINITAVTLLLLLFYSGHPGKRVLLFSIPFIMIFFSTSTSMIFFGKGETTWFQWGLVHITEESFFRGVHLGFRALNFAILGLLFALTTRPVSFFYSLMQQLKVPPKYAYSFMAALRLLPIMLEEFQTLRFAYKVRGVQAQKGLRGLYQKLKFYAIPLLAQSIRRAQRIAVAMEAKRFSQVSERTFYYQMGYSRYDWLFALYLLFGMSLMIFLGIYVPYFDVFDVRHVD